MTFFCQGCDQEKDYSLFSILIIERWGHGIKRFCKDCRNPSPCVPDVYFDGKPEHNLADDPTTGQPRVFFSKGEKAAYLKQRGLMEAGDRVHGAPMMIHQNQNRKVDTKPQVQEALRKVMQMSPSARHREYQRIRKEGRHEA